MDNETFSVQVRNSEIKGSVITPLIARLLVLDSKFLLCQHLRIMVSFPIAFPSKGAFRYFYSARSECVINIE